MWKYHLISGFYWLLLILFSPFWARLSTCAYTVCCNDVDALGQLLQLLPVLGILNLFPKIQMQLSSLNLVNCIFKYWAALLLGWYHGCFVSSGLKPQPHSVCAERVCGTCVFSPVSQGCSPSNLFSYAVHRHVLDFLWAGSSTRTKTIRIIFRELK